MINKTTIVNILLSLIFFLQNCMKHYYIYIEEMYAVFVEYPQQVSCTKKTGQYDRLELYPSDQPI